MAGACFVVVDTESSVRCEDSLRVLMSLAYEVVTVTDGLAVSARHYDLVTQHPDTVLDSLSERVHGISAARAHRRGRSLFSVMQRFLHVVARYKPLAMVGHDVVADAALLVSEAIRVGLPTHVLREPFQHLLCTKELATGHCQIPLPAHLRYDFPCDLLLQRMNGPTHGDHPPGPRFKWPNLDPGGRGALLRRSPRSPRCKECCQMLLGEDEEGVTPRFPPHDARGDVERCRRVLGRLLRQP
jgi:DNA polymerase III epsilon subunit-like protein